MNHHARQKSRKILDADSQTGVEHDRSTYPEISANCHIIVNHRLRFFDQMFEYMAHSGTHDWRLNVMAKYKAMYTNEICHGQQTFVAIGRVAMPEGIHGHAKTPGARKYVRNFKRRRGTDAMATAETNTTKKCSHCRTAIIGHLHRYRDLFPNSRRRMDSNHWGYIEWEKWIEMSSEI